LIDWCMPFLVLAIIIVDARAWLSHTWATPAWSSLEADPAQYLDAWSLLSAGQTDADLSSVVLLLQLFRLIEYLEKLPWGLGVTLQSILDMWFAPRAVLYLGILFLLMAAQALAYNLVFSLTSLSLNTVTQTFFSLFRSGLHSLDFDFAGSDARSLTTLLSLLWPIMFLAFVSGYIAVLGDAFHEVSMVAQAKWSLGIVSTLREALLWKENSLVRRINQVLFQKGGKLSTTTRYCCSLCSGVKSTPPQKTTKQQQLYGTSGSSVSDATSPGPLRMALHRLMYALGKALSCLFNTRLNVGDLTRGFKKNSSSWVFLALPALSLSFSFALFSWVAVWSDKMLYFMSKKSAPSAASDPPSTSSTTASVGPPAVVPSNSLPRHADVLSTLPTTASELRSAEEVVKTQKAWEGVWELESYLLQAKYMLGKREGYKKF